MIRAFPTGAGRPLGYTVENDMLVADHDNIITWDKTARRYASTFGLLRNIILYILIAVAFS